MSDSDDPKSKPSAGSWEEEGEDSQDAESTGRQPSVSHRRVDSHSCLSPVQETVDPQYKVNIAEAHTSKGRLKKDSPTKDNNTARRFFGSEKVNGRSHTHYSPTASWKARSSSKGEGGVSASQETTVLPKPAHLASHVPDATPPLLASHVPDATPPLLEPHVPDATPHVPSATPHVPSATPHVPSATPHVPSATPHVPSATPHVPSATPLRAPPPRIFQHHNSDKAVEEMGGATQKGGRAPGENLKLMRAPGENLKLMRAPGQGYGTIPGSLPSGGECAVPQSSPGTQQSQTSATQIEVQDERQVARQPLTVGHGPPNNAGNPGLPPQQGDDDDQPQLEPIYFNPRTRVEKCRCYCVWYAIVFTILCSVAIAVWTAAISPSKKRQHYFTSLDEVMKLDTNSYTTGMLSLQANDPGPDCSINTMTAFRVPCNKLSTLFQIRQTSHRRTDMIGYFVAFIVVTLFGLFLVYSCPIYRTTRECLQHRYTRRARHYIGLF